MTKITHNDTTYTFDFDRGILTFDNLKTEAYQAWLMPDKQTMYKVQFALMIKISANSVDLKKFGELIEVAICRCASSDLTGVYHIIFSEYGLAEMAAVEISGPHDSREQHTLYVRNDWLPTSGEYEVEAKGREITKIATDRIQTSLQEEMG